MSLLQRWTPGKVCSTLLVLNTKTLSWKQSNFFRLAMIQTILVSLVKSLLIDIYRHWNNLMSGPIFLTTFFYPWSLAQKRQFIMPLVSSIIFLIDVCIFLRRETFMQFEAVNLHIYLGNICPNKASFNALAKNQSHITLDY